MKTNFSAAMSGTLLSVILLPLMVAGCTTNATTPNKNSPTPEIPEAGKDTEPQAYAPFFTYPYANGMEIQPATGGILVMKDGCLLIQNDDRLNVPVFPHGITTWNEETQTLTANGVDIPLNTELFTNGPLSGGKYDPSYDYNFEQQANPKCLENRYIVFLGSQFMDATDLPNN